MAHGSGGRLTSGLIDRLLLPRFNNPRLAPLADAAVVDLKEASWAFTTDAYVIKPLFFPGGDIGKLAVCGTINDLAVMGAAPMYLSCGLIMEEGLAMDTLERVVCSMGQTARLAGVEVVTGDTKVVGRGEADGLFIHMSGLGMVKEGISLGQEKIRVGDKVLINGTIGDHGIAVLSAREKLHFETAIQSDAAPLHSLIAGMLEVSDQIKIMRDPTRGGLATTLNELVRGMNFGLTLEEEALPVSKEILTLCRLIGFEPLYVANEGKVVVIAAREDADLLLKTMRSHPQGRESRIIGEVTSGPAGRVLLHTATGGKRLVDTLAADQLPRIC